MFNIIHNSSVTAVIFQALSNESPLPNVEEIMAGAQMVNRSSVGALAFLFYDVCLTFDEEVELFWPYVGSVSILESSDWKNGVWIRRNWTFMKFNFFFLRYVPLLAQIAHSSVSFHHP
ncbi:hypothetical protein L218DRAFT_1002249 [Marasmius fiardii PR-910]|nr:hypothetical protein L218DRAFT_1002249 [Marasmius fiardii PR-910]